MVLKRLKIWSLSAKVTRREEQQTHSNLYTYQNSYRYTGLFKVIVGVLTTLSCTMHLR